jgi:hypothetical protein
VSFNAQSWKTLLKGPSFDPFDSFDPQAMDNHAVDSLDSGGALEYVFVTF